MQLWRDHSAMRADETPCSGVSRRRGAAWGVAALAGSLLAAACSQAPRATEPTSLLRDELFAPVAVVADPRQVLAPSEAMRRYADERLAGPSAPRDHRQALLLALQHPQGLQLRYDTEVTRTAAEAFEQRAGNCLSLVMMTAAFARHLGLPVRLQSVVVDEEYSRAGGLFLAAGHVNLSVGRHERVADAREPTWTTIDFLPDVDLRRQRVRPLSEPTMLAMYLNNRAAEALAAERIDESYAWARAALLRDPAYLPGVNTLGVVYTRAGHPQPAERALRHVIEHDPENPHALSNLARLLESQGRPAEAAPLAARLAELQPQPPFWYFDRGREAMARGDFAAARDLFRRELRRQPNQHEVHHQLAVAYAALGDAAAAARHLEIARENSPTRGTRALYAGKLEQLRSDRAQ